MNDFPSGGVTREYAGGKMLAAKDDGVGLITFNQPEKRNAMSLEMWTGLRRDPRRVRARTARCAW